jgi:nitrogen fixation protein FixH
MVQNQSFSGKVDENPYLHLQEFEQTCDCLRIEGMSDETLRWKPFPFSLKGRAKKWYNRTIEKKQGD